MTTVSTLGIVPSTPGNMVLSSGVGPPVPIPSYYLVPNLFITITNSNGGQTLTFRSTVLEATINYGYDVGVSTAEVQFTTDPSPNFTLNLANYSVVNIFGGCDPLGPNYNALRFSGLFLRTEATLWPHVYTMICRGNLYRAIQYRQATDVGLPAADIPGGYAPGVPIVQSFDADGNPATGWFSGTLGVNSTDGNCVYDILAAVPVLGPTIVPSNIQGTGFMVLKSLYDLLWPPYKSAWEMIQMFDQVFLGYRTYEDVGGVVRRQRIFAYPQGKGDTQFTEGIDIWEAHGSRSIEPLINGVYVEGASRILPGAKHGVVFAYHQESNPFQPANQPVIEQFRSQLIETSDDIESGADASAVPLLNADRVAEWRLAEGNRQLVNVQLTTFRDDVLKIGHTIAVNAPHTAVQEPVWMQHVTIRVANQPVLWQQTVSGIGGGSPGYGGGVGVLAAGSTTTLLQTVDTYTDGALIGLAVSITDPSDPFNLNFTSPIVDNDPNSISVSVAFPATPATGDTYSIGTLPPS